MNKQTRNQPDNGRTAVAEKRSSGHGAGPEQTADSKTVAAHSPAAKRGHALITDESSRRLPKLYATENVKDPVVQVKFFSPWNGWTWYATEFDGEDVFFGLVDGFDAEWGYFSLSELDAVEGPCGVPAVERDLYFEPVPASTLKLRGYGSE